MYKINSFTGYVEGEKALGLKWSFLRSLNP